MRELLTLVTLFDDAFVADFQKTMDMLFLKVVSSEVRNAIADVRVTAAILTTLCVCRGRWCGRLSGPWRYPSRCCCWSSPSRTFATRWAARHQAARRYVS